MVFVASDIEGLNIRGYIDFPCCGKRLWQVPGSFRPLCYTGAAMFGVYIHFPYCRKRCPYCDFAVHARARIPHERYAKAVLREVDVRAALFSGRRAVSVYFGGGTPGLWRPDCVAQVLAGVRERFAVPTDAEVTL